MFAETLSGARHLAEKYPEIWAGVAMLALAASAARARTGATTTLAGSPWVRRHMVRRRRPMVSTLGLTRSNGSVSHAGKVSTED